MLKRRLFSWLFDYLVIFALLAAVFIVLGIPTIAGWIETDAVWNNPVLSDLAITALTVGPFLTYLTVTESGPRSATWGKRREGLRVVDIDGSEPRTGQVVLRNVVKLLPWQFGHMGAARFADPQGNTKLAVIYDTVSLLIVVAVAVPPLIGRRGLHDVLAGTSVEEDPRAYTSGRSTGIESELRRRRRRSRR